MSTDSKPRPISGHDRRWMGANGVILATGVGTRPVERARELFAEFMELHPQHPLACRIDRKGHRWVPVPAADRAVHVQRLMIAADDPDPEDLEPYIRARIDALSSELPFLAVVSPQSIFLIVCHGIGDGVTVDRLSASLLARDAASDSEVVARLAALEPRITWMPVARELVRGLRRHRQDWLAHVPNPLRRRAGAGGPAAPRPVSPGRPAFTSVIVTNEQLRGLLRWRNREASKASIAAVLTCATYRALAGQGIVIDPQGYYAILDIRPYLPVGSAERFGNGAKSLRLTADLDDPMAISTALKEAADNRRVVPAVALSSPMRRRPPAGSPPAQGAGRLALTFTFQPTSAEMPRLPALVGQPRSLYGFGTPASAGGVAVFAVRLREHMQITASFDESTVSMESVRKALASLTDPRSVLDAPLQRLT